MTSRGITGTTTPKAVKAKHTARNTPAKVGPQLVSSAIGVMHSPLLSPHTV